MAQYPQRPMVRLKPGQIVETELDGDWMKATVEKVDASLALMKFSRTHSEWIYRGSTRLEPLFSDLLTSQSKSVPTHNQRVEVEYSSVDVPTFHNITSCVENLRFYSLSSSIISLS
ncbi:unnamed protein product [Schistosoma mattheei]|uniref:Histone methyltransferase Tudor domain-containing protein n=1 Tax=Schistosoma mattheei TaxID=31246 RepID=A0A3P8C895_9TREM|nr:unnamed protein product [Schistosoma mattheei]